MRLVVQRVNEASCLVGGKISGEIGKGFMVLVGFGLNDEEAVVKKMAEKLSRLRIFDDENGKIKIDADSSMFVILESTSFYSYLPISLSYDSVLSANLKSDLLASVSLTEGAIQQGERDAKKVIDIIRENLQTEPLARIDYVEVVDFENIQRTPRISGETLVAIAVYIGKTRLIDNFIVSI